MRPGGGWRSPRRPVSWSAAAPPDAPARADPRPVADLKSEHVDPGLVPGIAAVSAVSLIGGASLGPEKALGAMGGGAGSWFARRRALGNEDAQVNTLVGFTGAYGGLFSSTVIVVMLILEAARPGGHGRLPDPVGALQTAPILIAVITALLTMEGMKYLVTTRRQSRAAAANQPASPNGPNTEGRPSQRLARRPPDRVLERPALPRCVLHRPVRHALGRKRGAPMMLPTDRPTTTGRRCGRLARSGRGRGPGGEAAVSSSQPPSTH
jgi:hypothetical protein